MLAVLSAFSCMQCACWFAFSSVDPALVKEFMGSAVANDATIGLLLNWGPIVGVLTAPLQIRMGASKGDASGGFKASIVAGAWLVFLGSALRCAPCLAAPGRRGDRWSVACLHGGQILNAAAGPLCMGTVARLSCLWFPERERLFSTSVGSAANALGVVVMYPLAPRVVAAAADLPHLLYGLLAASALPALCAAVAFPAAPPHPPSAAAEAAAAEISGRSGAHWRDDLRLLLVRRKRADAPATAARSYGATVLAAGAVAGAATAWQGVFQTVLKGRLTAKQIGWLGFANTGLGCVGALLVSSPAAAAWTRRAGLRAALLGLLGASAAFALAWSLFDGLAASGGAGFFLAALGLAGALGGAQGAADPVFVELAAELVPVRETTSNGLLVLVWNGTSCVLLALPPGLLGRAMNWAFCGVLVAAAALVYLGVTEVHCRPRDADSGVAIQDSASDASATF